MQPRHVRPISRELIATLSSARLRAYRRRLMSLEDRPEAGDWTLDELAGLPASLVFFKSDPRWRALEQAVASELLTRVRR